MPNRYLRERAMSRRDSGRGGRGTHVSGHYRDFGDMRRGMQQGMDSGGDYRTRIPSDYPMAYERSGNLRGHAELGMYRGRSQEMMGGRRGMDSRDYRSDYNMGMDSRDYRSDYRDYNDYRGGGDYRDYNYDSRDYNDYRGDYNDYNDYGSDQEYKKDLQDWIQKLKKHDKFKMNEREIIEKAQQMGVKFDKYDEDTFIAAFYLMQAMNPSVSNDPHMYLAMGKSFLEFKEMAVEPEEALCIYMYKIIKGE